MTAPRPRILLVEDDPLLRDSFAILLDDAGYDVLAAGTADEALTFVDDAHPALVILDLGLPDRPGLDVVRAIRQDPERAGTPVIALTGRVGAAEREASLEAGVDRYLVKPVPPVRLLEQLAAFMKG